MANRNIGFPSLWFATAIRSGLHACARPTSGVASGEVDLILGSSYTGLKGAAPTASPSPTASSGASSINNVTKTYGGISGNANICGDKGAFSGPDQPSEFSP